MGKFLFFGQEKLLPPSTTYPISDTYKYNFNLPHRLKKPADKKLKKHLWDLFNLWGNKFKELPRVQLFGSGSTRLGLSKIKGARHAFDKI